MTPRGRLRRIGINPDAYGYSEAVEPTLTVLELNRAGRADPLEAHCSPSREGSPTSPLTEAFSHTPVWKLSQFAREGDHTVAHS